MRPWVSGACVIAANTMAHHHGLKAPTIAEPLPTIANHRQPHRQLSPTIANLRALIFPIGCVDTRSPGLSDPNPLIRHPTSDMELGPVGSKPPPDIRHGAMPASTNDSTNDRTEVGNFFSLPSLRKGSSTNEPPNEPPQEQPNEPQSEPPLRFGLILGPVIFCQNPNHEQSRITTAKQERDAALCVCKCREKLKRARRKKN